MVVLTLSQTYMLSRSDSTSPGMEMHVFVTGNDDDTCTVKCWHKQFPEPEKILEIGDMVHINVDQYGGHQEEIEKEYKANHKNFGEAEITHLRQFMVLSLESWIDPSLNNRRSCRVLLQERDRQDPDNDGVYWVFYTRFRTPYAPEVEKYLARIGRELTDETIAEAETRGEKCEEGRLTDIEMAPTEYIKFCWDYYVRHSYYNENYGNAVSLSTKRFPDQDPDPDEGKVTAISIFALPLAIIWGFIPEGMTGLTYFLAAAFFSALFFVFNNSWFIILCIWIIYWTNNARLKTNSRF